MSQRSEKLHRKVDRLEDHVSFLDGRLSALEDDLAFNATLASVQKAGEMEELKRWLSREQRRAREAKSAARGWFWTFLVLALLLIVLIALYSPQSKAAEKVQQTNSLKIESLSLPTAQVELTGKPAAAEETTEDQNRQLHGSCRITAYCACEICCGEWAKKRPLDDNGDPIVCGASGQELTPGVSVASSLPYGTKLEIDGLPGTYIVQDRTSEWVHDKYAGMVVDIYMDSHEACYELLQGMPEWMDVYIVE